MKFELEREMLKPSQTPGRPLETEQRIDARSCAVYRSLTPWTTSLPAECAAPEEAAFYGGSAEGVKRAVTERLQDVFLDTDIGVWDCLLV